VDNNDPQNGSWVVHPHVSTLEEGSHFTTTDDKSFNNRNGYEEFISNEKMANMIYSKFRPCLNCGNKKKCAPGISVTLWGQKLPNRCKFIGTPFYDPDSDELECAKLLIKIYCELKGVG
jgi:hypothetical protein